MKQKIDALIVTVLLFVLPLCGCGNGGGDGDAVPLSALSISGNDFYAPIDVQLVHGTALVVRAVVNGSISLDMLVDTGSAGTWVPAGIFGNPGGQVYISSLCLDNDICFNNFMAWSSGSGFTQSKQGYYNGIIGVDLLKNFDLTFDYKNELMYCCDTLENSPPPGLVMIPFHYETDRPFTDVVIESLSQGATLLDTGAAYTRITPSIFGFLSQNPGKLFDSVVFNLNGSEIVEYVPLTDYCVGAACPDEIIVQIGSWPAVGGTFFREYLTIFKFSENVVKLDPYQDRSHIKESGIQRIGLQINIYDASEIVHVVDGSLAWTGGLRAGYEIISVNGIPIDSLGYFGIYDFLADTSVDEYQFFVETTDGDIEDVTISVQP